MRDINKKLEDNIIFIHRSKLKPFEEQPYKVLMNESMDELVNSIRLNGVLTPIIVRKLIDGQYEIVSGHRRVTAGKMANIHKFPAIVKELSDDEAAILLVDSNLQRENILPSEKAFAYKLKLDAMKRQGRRTDLTSAQLGQKLGATSRDILAKQVGESKNQISRYIRLTYLIDKLLDMVDSKRMPLNVGVELSYLGSKAQSYIAELLECDEIMLSLRQAHMLKEVSKDGKVSEDEILAIVCERKLPKRNITIKNKCIKKYFPESYSREEIEDIVVGLIKQWAEKNMRNGGTNIR